MDGFFGGADAKALVAISVILPVYYPLMSFHAHPITGITVLTNAVIFAMVVPMYNALSNLAKVARGERIFEGFKEEPVWRKVLACFVGAPSIGQKRHHSAIECPADGKKKFSFHLSSDKVVSKDGCHSRIFANGPVWLSQNLPFLVFLLVGFVASMLFGDLLLMIMLLGHQ